MFAEQIPPHLLQASASSKRSIFTAVSLVLEACVAAAEQRDAPFFQIAKPDLNRTSLSEISIRSTVDGTEIENVRGQAPGVAKI